MRLDPYDRASLYSAGVPRRRVAHGFAAHPGEMMAQQLSSVLLSACRTPFGKLGGALASLPAVDLGAHVIRAAIQRAGISGADVQHVIMGMVVQAGAGHIPSQ